MNNLLRENMIFNSKIYNQFKNMLYSCKIMMTIFGMCKQIMKIRILWINKVIVQNKYIKIF